MRRGQASRILASLLVLPMLVLPMLVLPMSHILMYRQDGGYAAMLHFAAYVIVNKAKCSAVNVNAVQCKQCMQSMQSSS